MMPEARDINCCDWPSTKAVGIRFTHVCGLKQVDAELRSDTVIFAFNRDEVGVDHLGLIVDESLRRSFQKVVWKPKREQRVPDSQQWIVIWIGQFSRYCEIIKISD